MKSIKVLAIACLSSVSVLAQNETDTIYAIPRKIGWKFEWGPATGMAFALNDASEFVSNSFYVNFGLGMTYHKVVHLARFTGSSTTIKRDLPSEPLWERGNSFNSMNVELLTGFKVYKSRRIDLIPYSGVLMAGITTAVDGEVIDRNDWVINWTLGFMTAFKFNIPSNRKTEFRWEILDHELSHFYVRSFFGLYPNYFRSFELEGSQLYFNFSLGFHLRTAHWIYPADRN